MPKNPFRAPRCLGHARKAPPPHPPAVKGHEAKNKNRRSRKEKTNYPGCALFRVPRRPRPGLRGQPQAHPARGGKPRARAQTRRWRIPAQTPRPTASAAPMPQNGAPMQPSLEGRDGQSKEAGPAGQTHGRFSTGRFWPPSRRGRKQALQPRQTPQAGQGARAAACYPANQGRKAQKSG